jgi:hypothetical protein
VLHDRRSNARSPNSSCQLNRIPAGGCGADAHVGVVACAWAGTLVRVAASNNVAVPKIRSLII